jgi:hypothetical protein
VNLAEIQHNRWGPFDESAPSPPLARPSSLRFAAALCLREPLPTLHRPYACDSFLTRLSGLPQATAAAVAPPRLLSWVRAHPIALHCPALPTRPACTAVCPAPWPESNIESASPTGEKKGGCGLTAGRVALVT